MHFFRPTQLYILPLCLALLFLAASLTPTLIPRGWLVQGVLGGVVMGLGYLIGRLAVSLWRLLNLPEPQGRLATIARLIVGVPAVVILILCLASARDWQNGIRTRMGLDPVESSHTIQMLVMVIIVFVGLVLLGYALQRVFDLLRQHLYRYMPARTANVAGFLLTVILVVTLTWDGILDRVIAGLDQSYTRAQNLFADAPPAPEEARLTGSSESLVDWQALGQPGRDYVRSGPDAKDIAAFLGVDALDPIRVYVGLAQADTPEARAEIALQELIRQGGFNRSVLIVALPTGTGWMDPGAMDPVEYMHGGDVATVAVQYSYLQSPLALILETRAGLDQARALIGAVHAYWRELPKNNRPRLYIHGLSLGAWSSMYGTDLFALLDDPINGALWAGPPFPSQKWREIVAERNLDSPYVAPELGKGQLVRFASHVNDAGGSEGWGNMRLIYLQYPSDPIVFFEQTSFFRAPQWMMEPPGHGVSPDMKFMPVVTAFQLAIDMALANTAPPGYGHAYYARDYIGPWVALTDPEGWTNELSTRLIAHCDNGFQEGCDNGSR